MGNKSDTQKNWRNSYFELIQFLELKTEDHDKRKHPRILVPPGIELYVEIGSESLRVLDISPGGISLVSKKPLSGSSEVNIIYDKLFKISSEIIYSRVDPTEDFGEGEHYRIGARFLKEDEGFRILV
ncbi:MAG: PilZ domain-containing protein, partial [bacterium]